ncbi:MAG: acetyl-CoA carboxylase biotin carboxylase subunit, partial [Desulfobacterales bacterium]
MKSKSMYILIAVAAIFIILYASAFVVDETEQVVVTQFGKVVGDAKTEPGLYFKIPFIQNATYFPKYLIQWDGDPGQVPTLEKTYIWVDTFARWKIVDPVKFFQTVNNAIIAKGRLDDIIDPAVRNFITSYRLIETVIKILIANRGEIAIRIMRTCRELDIETVAVFSEIDRTSQHVRYAHEAYYVGKAPSSESYLDIEKIIKVALESNSDAIHPGYGFLSENAAFAQRCQDEGIIFIGPAPGVIQQMGDKITARETMIHAGIPVVPGTTGNLNDEKEALEAIRIIGLPVMIKASAGGGGKGMRLVNEENNIIPALQAAQSEAKTAFGNDSVYIEKYITSPHHIEFQILSDKYGNTVHLFERECSVQRRHQKMIEETPSPLITAALREEMGRTAVEAAKAVNYTGAGTIEFLVNEELCYYFLEMNTRLQVEHPITERVTGIDLVKEQIKIAEGQKLELTQNELNQEGHSIECRIYAEDPDNNFMPSAGKIHKISEPLGLGVRTDGYVYEGYEIPIFYDPLISKL